MKNILIGIVVCLSAILHALPLAGKDMLVGGQIIDQETASFFLIEAIFKGDKAVCNRLFKAGLSPNECLDRFPVGSSPREQFGMVGHGIGSPTPLIAATIYRDEEMIRFLIEQGADPNLAVKDHLNRGTWTPLKTACVVNSTSCFRLLVEKGADPRWKEPVTGRNLAHYALAMRADQENSADDTESWAVFLQRYAVSSDEKDAEGSSARDYLTILREERTKPMNLRGSSDAERCGQVRSILMGALEMAQIDSPENVASMKTIELGPDAPLVKAEYIRANMLAPTPQCVYRAVKNSAGEIEVRCDVHK